MKPLLQLRHEAAKTILSYVCGPRGLRAVSKPKRPVADKDAKEKNVKESEPNQLQAG